MIGDPAEHVDFIFKCTCGLDPCEFRIPQLSEHTPAEWATLVLRGKREPGRVGGARGGARGTGTFGRRPRGGGGLGHRGGGGRGSGGGDDESAAAAKKGAAK